MDFDNVIFYNEHVCQHVGPISSNCRRFNNHSKRWGRLTVVIDWRETYMFCEKCSITKTDNLQKKNNHNITQDSRQLRLFAWKKKKHKTRVLSYLRYKVLRVQNIASNIKPGRGREIDRDLKVFLARHHHIINRLKSFVCKEPNINIWILA